MANTPLVEGLTEGKSETSVGPARLHAKEPAVEPALCAWR
jgi:hypothetical protein